MYRNARLNVDVLVCFCPGGELPAPGGDEVVKIINAKTLKTPSEFWTVNVFIADCHDPDNTDHFSQWVKHGIRDTPGQKFHPDLIIPDGSFIVYKGTGKKNNGYSGFDHEDVEIYIKSHNRLFRLVIPTLDALLKFLGVETIEIRGIATNFCDKETAIDGVKLGYLTILHLDGCRAIPFPDDDPRSEKNAIAEMRKAGVIIL